MLEQETLRELLRSERKKKNITQKEMAVLLNQTNNYVCDYENGRRPISIKILNNVSSALGINISLTVKEEK